jgi:transcriptional regulator with XRE-family HTH domain
MNIHFVEEEKVAGETKTPSPIDVAVGQRVRMRRNILGMSQTTLAEALGITFQQVQKYEKGSNRIGASRLSHIASVLNVQVSFFFEGSEASSSDTNGQELLSSNEITAFLSSAEGVALNKAFARIESTGLRKKIVALVSAIGRAEE